VNEKVGTFQKEFNEVAREGQRFAIASRAKEFQLQACQNLDALRLKASRLKEETIAASDEDSANAMLSIEEMILGLTSELKMWIALKEDDPNRAWNDLMDAQDHTRTVMQAHAIAGHLSGYSSRLHALEVLLFPPLTFCSPGLVVKHAKCSICEQEYGECDHVVGRPYIGKMCTAIVTEIKEFREVSLVKQPANKRARIMSLIENGMERDIMTWRTVPAKPLTKTT